MSLYHCAACSKDTRLLPLNPAVITCPQCRQIVISRHTDLLDDPLKPLPSNDSEDQLSLFGELLQGNDCPPGI